MRFKVSEKIFESYPDLMVGVIVVKDVVNTGSSEELVGLLRQAETELRQMPGIEPVNQHPKIASWREAHKKFGNSPKKYPPSVQAVVRRVVKGGQLPHINKLVDIYNYINPHDLANYVSYAAIHKASSLN